MIYSNSDKLFYRSTKQNEYNNQTVTPTSPSISESLWRCALRASCEDPGCERCSSCSAPTYSSSVNCLPRFRMPFRISCEAKTINVFTIATERDRQLINIDPKKPSTPQWPQPQHLRR